MRKFLVAVFSSSVALAGCGASYTASAPTQTTMNPQVQAASLKGDLVALMDRMLAQDDVMMAEAGKAKTPADQLRFTKQAYQGLFSLTSQVQERAGQVGLNPFEAKKKKAILDETTNSLWKLRYLEKEGAAKAATAEARLELYDRLHTDAYNSLTRVKDILAGRL